MNWLGFSLSPQEQPHHHHHDHQDHSQSTVSHRLGFNSDEISGNDVSGECFDLTSDSTAPSLNQLPPPFGILEAFNRSNNHSQGLLFTFFFPFFGKQIFKYYSY